MHLIASYLKTHILDDFDSFFMQRKYSKEAREFTAFAFFFL